MTDQKTPDGTKTTAPALTSKFTIAGRTYELVPILREGEGSVTSDTMMERARELNANLGEEDATFIVEHWAEIPQEFRRKFNLVFTAWRRSSDPWDVACLSCHGDRWYRGWDGPDSRWYGRDRLVRRVS